MNAKTGQWLYSTGYRIHYLNSIGINYKDPSTTHTKCLICDNTFLIKEMHVHHLKPKAKYPELIYELGNMILICEDCHRNQHNVKKWSYIK